MSKWRFNLRNSKDLSLIGELTGASGKSVTLAHNSPGSANWNYSMSDQLAPYIQPFSTCISAERYNWRATQALAAPVRCGTGSGQALSCQLMRIGLAI
jgi:hypothetical protein